MREPPGIVMIAPGKLGAGSFAAVAIAPSAVPGEPVMYWLGPLLPAEVTTMTPAFAAFVEATADGSSFVPNDGAERHVDHVHVVVDRPLDRVHGDIGRAFAAEDANGVDVGLRRDAGADPSSCCR